MTETCNNCGKPIFIDGGAWVHSDQYAHCYATDSTSTANPKADPND